KITLEINKKLDAGWLPYYDMQNVSDYKTVEYCFEKFLTQIKSDKDKNEKRSDTIRSYISHITMLRKYIASKRNINLILEFNKAFVVNYLDWIFYERKNSARTYNNHLNFIGGF